MVVILELVYVYFRKEDESEVFFHACIHTQNFTLLMAW